ncbi:MAG: ParB N-terminal domain-containing protein, partial [Candidatus Paceibacteria bacterium]
MEIKIAKISKLKRAEYNPRKKSEHVLATVRQSIKEYGWLQPIVVNTHQCERCGDRRNVIVGGHRRLEAAQAEGKDEAPIIEVNLHLEDEKRANLRLNAQEPFDRKSLADLVTELHALDAAQSATLGFDVNEIIRLLFEARYQGNKLEGILREKFLVPPFSVFDTKQGAWQKRKAQWREVIGDFGETREGVLSKGDTNILMRGINYGTSFFDPVLAEVIYLWFMPDKGVILDPFAGEQTKAFV